MFAPPVQTLSIPNAGTDSPELNLAGDINRGPIIIEILAPAVVTGTITIQVSNVSGGTFRTLTTGGADVAIAAAKAVIVTDLPATGVLRIHSSATEAAQRDFVVLGANKFR
jgi:hypothetical protein